jgi:hypothetical protein
MKDFEIREILKLTALKEHYDNENARVVHELELPTTGTRVDIAVINGYLYGYEIKGAGDSLRRLEHQIQGYSKVFDYLAVVTERKHCKKVNEIIPRWVGVIVVDEMGIYFERESQLNQSRCGFSLAQLLWKAELLYVCRLVGLTRLSKYTVWGLCELLRDNISVDLISQHVNTRLLARTDWKMNRI